MCLIRISLADVHDVEQRPDDAVTAPAQGLLLAGVSGG
jgi:hypothetical protein